MFGRKKQREPLREDVEAAADAGQVSRAMFGKTLRGMEARLMNGEKVLDMAPVNHDGRAGVLVRTNYRLWFTVESVAGSASDALALERITSAQWDRDITKRKGIGTLNVSTGGRAMTFTLVPEQFATGVQMASA